MKIDELTIADLRKVSKLINLDTRPVAINTPQVKPHPFKIGECVYIRTVTHHHTGRVTEVIGDFVTLEDAAWIADSGRWMDALKTGMLGEVEPMFAPVRVNITSIIDINVWAHALPRSQI